jgi:predicted RNA-binding protein YlxR (DUF448 family)
VRLALGPEGRLLVDPRRAISGRGGYLCGPACVEGAVKRKAWGRAFRTKVLVESEVLRRELEALQAGPAANVALTAGSGKQ